MQTIFPAADIELIPVRIIRLFRHSPTPGSRLPHRNEFWAWLPQYKNPTLYAHIFEKQGFLFIYTRENPEHLHDSARLIPIHDIDDVKFL
jgi:hypothetical protein